MDQNIRNIIGKVLGVLLFILVMTTPAFVFADEAIKIGANLDTTGSNADFDEHAANGARLAIAEFNAKGGLGGRKVELIIENNRSQIAETTFAAERLADKGVVAMITPALPVNALAAATVSEKRKIPLVSTFSASSYVIENERGVRPYVFQIAFTTEYQGRAMGDFARKNLQTRSAGILIEEGSEFSEAIASSFKAEFEKNSGKVIKIYRYKSGQKDFDAILSELKVNGVDVLFAPGLSQDAARIIRLARRMGWEVPVVGSDRWNPMEMRPVAGYSALYNVYYCTEYDGDSPRGKALQFKNNYFKTYGKNPQLSAALSYDGTHMILAALSRAGEANSEKIQQEIGRTKNLLGATGSIEFHEGSHNVIRSIIIMEIELGREKFKEEHFLN